MLLDFILAIALLGQSTIEYNKTIDQLGDSQFVNRESAKARLLELDVTVMPQLIERITDPDPEIRQQIRYLISELQEYDHEGPYPSIWLLPNEIRFPGTGYEEDVAKHYYKLLYNRYYEEQMWFGRAWFPPEIYYDQMEFQNAATAQYIADIRLAGQSRNEVFELIKEMQNNRITKYRVKSTLEYELRRTLPPGPLLSKEVVDEGIAY